MRILPIRRVIIIDKLDTLLQQIFINKMIQSDTEVVKEKILSLLRLKYYFRGKQLLEEVEQASSSLNFSAEELVQAVKETATVENDIEKHLIRIYIPKIVKSAADVKNALKAAAVNPYEEEILDNNFYKNRHKPLRPDCNMYTNSTMEYAIQAFAANRLEYPGSLNLVGNIIHSPCSESPIYYVLKPTPESPYDIYRIAMTWDQERNDQLTRARESAAARYGIVGTSPALLRALGELERVSSATASVLLLGESGTGKELFARALHLASPRRDAPFIKVNCAAIPETLFESELFGHERGAFTGSHGERAGWFELADSGTIFLDEIGELPLALQTKLLRTLQEGTILRLGGKREKKIDVRLVAATHRDLEQEAALGTFRRDLFYRLYVIPIRLPSLRERPQDIPLLALHFLSRANQAHQRNVNLTPDALARLARHPWPGNIRELANVIERVVLLADAPVVSAQGLSRMLQDVDAVPRAALLPGHPLVHQLVHPPAHPIVRDYARADSIPAQVLMDALARSGGNQSRAAQTLGLTLRQFSYRCKKLGVVAG